MATFSSQGDLAPKKIKFEKLSANAYAFTAEGDPNTGVIVGDDSVMVIDAQATPLMAREVIGLLKHLQHAQGKTVIFVGILVKVTDEFNRTTWQPQLEGGKAGRELPGIVDQVISMSLFAAEDDSWRHDPERADIRRLVCRAGNPFGLPAKDRSGRLDVTEAPDLGALLAKINSPQTTNRKG